MCSCPHRARLLITYAAGSWICHWVGTGALILQTVWKIILGKWDRNRHHTSNVLQNLLSDIPLSRLVLCISQPSPEYLHAAYQDICRTKPQIRSPSATRASPPPPLPKQRPDADEEPGGCRLILKATKAPSLSPPSVLLHVVVPSSPCICPDTPTSSIACVMKFTTS